MPPPSKTPPPPPDARLAARACLVIAVAAAAASCSRPPAVGDAGRGPQQRLPPPARPDDLLFEAHFGQPRATARALSALTRQTVPLELGLALGLGVNSTLLAAVDLARPLDVVAAGSPTAPDFVFVFTPGPQNAFRSTLGARYRFVESPGLGERLEPREGGTGASARRARGDELHCAVVGVPEGGPAPPARVVCARRPEALAHAGRFAAYAAHARAADAGTDARVELEGAALRERVAPAARARLEQFAREMAQSAAEARRDHARPPDFGDPEALVATVNQLAQDLGPQAADLRRVSLRAQVGPREVTLDAEAPLDPGGRSALARDATARAQAPGAHPLAARLPPDAAVAVGSRVDAAARAATLRDVADAALRLLGARVPDPEAARADLHALVAQPGDAMAFAGGNDPQGGTEATLLVGLADGGASARAVLARLPRAAWLRGVRVGGAPVIATAQRGGAVVLRLGPPPADAPRPAAPPNVPGVPQPPPPRQLGLAVLGDVLAVVLAARPAEAFVALQARPAGGPLPATLAAAGEAPLAGGVRVRPREGSPQYVPFTYRATRDGADVTARGHLALPGAALGTLVALAQAMLQ